MRGELIHRMDLYTGKYEVVCTSKYCCIQKLFFFGFFQCELQHWVDVMDKFDEILASVAKPVNGSSWILAYDKLDQLEGLEIAVSFNCVFISWLEIHYCAFMVPNANIDGR